MVAVEPWLAAGAAPSPSIRSISLVVVRLMAVRAIGDCGPAIRFLRRKRETRTTISRTATVAPPPMAAIGVPPPDVSTVFGGGGSAEGGGGEGETESGLGGLEESHGCEVKSGGGSTEGDGEGDSGSVGGGGVGGGCGGSGRKGGGSAGGDEGGGGATTRAMLTFAAVAMLVTSGVASMPRREASSAAGALARVVAAASTVNAMSAAVPWLPSGAVSGMVRITSTLIQLVEARRRTSVMRRPAVASLARSSRKHAGSRHHS